MRTSRTLRTFWVIWWTFEDLRSEDVGDLLCIFLTFSGLCGPFEDFWKTCGPEDLKTLKNFLDLLRIWGLWGIQGLFRTLRIFANVITYWGIEDVDKFLRICGRFEYLLRTFEEFEDFEDLLSNLRIIWGPEAWGRWGPFCAFPDLLWTLWIFWGLFEDLRTWVSQNVEEQFRTFCWLLVDLLRTVFSNFWGLFVDLLRTWGLGGIQGLFRTLRIFANLTTYWGIEDVDKFLRTLWTIWISFEDLWGIRRLWGPLE